MANSSLTENPLILTVGPQVNVDGLVQSIFQTHGYSALKNEADYILYGRFHELGDAKNAVCDLLLVAQSDSDGVEDAVLRLGAAVTQLRMALVSGKPLHRDLLIQRQPFMRLHRALIQYSYEYHGKPVGFHLRPLIMVTDSTNLW